MMRALPILLLLAALGSGETGEESRDVTVELKPITPGDGARLGYYKARPVAVETVVPRFLFEVPAFKTKDPLFFRFALGETKGEPFYAAIDRSPGSTYHDRLYIDRDRDLDLTNDGEPVKAHITTTLSGDKFIEFLDVTLAVPYSDGDTVRTEPYACVLYYVAEGKLLPKTIQIERYGWREGAVQVGGKTYAMAFIDDDCDGNYTTGDTWSFTPEGTDAKQALGRESTRAMLFPAWSKDQKWVVQVKSIDLAGRRATLRIAVATETENQYFLKVYRQRQTPEERKLKIDPMRPKADDREKVKWLRNEKGVRYALEVAGSPNVNKRVLLDFTAKNCVWCARMERYTFRDREVVQLTENFVCAKIPFKPGATDTEKHHVEGTPTYVVLDKDGSEIARQTGFARPAEFARWLKSTLR